MKAKVGQRQRTLVVLTLKQEAFAQHVARGETLAEAHRLAGYNCSANSIYAVASVLAKRPKVMARINSIKAERMKALMQAETATMIVTAQSVGSMLAEAYEDAKRWKQTGSQVAAAMGLAKLHGLLVDKTEDVTRRATRDPYAPVEIDVDHWVTEQVALLAPSPSPESPANSAEVSLETPLEIDRRVPHESPLPDGQESPESPEGSGAAESPESPEGS
jgi:hypothetical protein